MTINYIFGKLTIDKLPKRSKQVNTKVKMETTTSFPYSIVRFCTMNEVQVIAIIWNSRNNIHSVFPEKGDSRTLQHSLWKVYWRRKNGKVSKYWFIWDMWLPDSSLLISSWIHSRERQPELAASTIINTLKEKVKPLAKHWNKLIFFFFSCEGQLNTCTFVSVCPSVRLSVSKLNFSLFMTTYDSL